MTTAPPAGQAPELAHEPAADPHAGYGEVLRQPGTVRVAAAGVLARLPIPMSGVGLVLLCRQTPLGVGGGGLVASLFGLCAAVGAPLWGRLCDRRGARGVLVASGLGQALGLLLLVPAVHHGLGAALGAAVVAGLLEPPVAGVVRAQWEALPGPLRGTAQSLESVLVELVFLSGPLLVGLVVALARPAAVPPVAAVTVVVGSLVLATAPTLRPPQPATHAHGPLGPLRFPALRVLGGVFALQVVAFGSVEVALTVTAADAGRQALAGPLLSLWAGGSAVGGLVWGARAHRAPLRRQLLLTTGAVPVLLLLFLVTTDPAWLVAVALPAGLAIAPGASVVSRLVGLAVPPAEHAEAYGWLAGAATLGGSTGYAVASQVAQHTTRGTLLLGIACAAAAPALALLGRRALPG